MVGRLQAKLGGVLGILAKAAAVVVVLAISTIGLRQHSVVRPADVDFTTTLKYLLQGDNFPKPPVEGEPLLGSYLVISAPTEEELRKNLEKSRAAGLPSDGESRYANN